MGIYSEFRLATPPPQPRVFSWRIKLHFQRGSRNARNIYMHFLLWFWFCGPWRSSSFLSLKQRVRVDMTRDYFFTLSIQNGIQAFLKPFLILLFAFSFFALENNTYLNCKISIKMHECTVRLKMFYISFELIFNGLQIHFVAMYYAHR